MTDRTNKNTAFTVKTDIINDDTKVNVEDGALYVRGGDMVAHINGQRKILATTSVDALSGVIIVNQSNAATVLANIDSTKQYYVDGVVDISGIEIDIPQGGASFRGYDFYNSRFYSNSDNYTMFDGAADNGNFLMSDLSIEVVGTGSQVYSLKGATGNEAFEVIRVNYFNCTSLGIIDNYRQGLESGTGRFGGTPTLTLAGVWLGGYRATTTIARGLSDTMNAPLFKAGLGFQMNSRFLTDANVDLGLTASLIDFDGSEFPNSSTIQIKDALITRNGIADASDLTTTPNILASNVKCDWQENNGVDNTFFGGYLNNSAEVETVLAFNVPSLLNGTWDALDLQHFESSVNGRLTHLGDSPRDYKVNVDIVIDGGANDELLFEVIKNKGGQLITVMSQQRTVNNLQGGRDVAFFSRAFTVVMDDQDYMYMQVTNLTDATNVTAEIDSILIIEER